ncbi:MAG: leucine-rich repeat domain-containing protein [Promethearchaeota archaeon]
MSLEEYEGVKLAVEEVVFLRDLEDYIRKIGKKAKVIPLLDQFNRKAFGFTQKDGHIIELSLFNKGLKASKDNSKYKTIPESIENLKHLKVLNLWMNELDSLPDTIGGLESLEVLDLDTNKLSKLPDSIGSLKNLRVLDLDTNQLKTLPSTISNLKNLKELSLSWNNFTNLPKELGDLESLEVLRVNYNSKLSGLPETLQNLKNLKKLYLREANFSGKSLEKTHKVLRKLEKANCTIYGVKF